MASAAASVAVNAVRLAPSAAGGERRGFATYKTVRGRLIKSHLPSTAGRRALPRRRRVGEGHSLDHEQQLVARAAGDDTNSSSPVVTSSVDAELAKAEAQLLFMLSPDYPQAPRYVVLRTPCLFSDVLDF